MEFGFYRPSIAWSVGLSQYYVGLRRCGQLLHTTAWFVVVQPFLQGSLNYHSLVSPAKTAEPIEMPFGLTTLVSPKTNALDRNPHPHGKEQF